MNTKQMRYFLAVAETLNFRRAAQGLHMTQPPLSQQIAALEEELGVRLFVRDRRRVRLTAAGESLARDVRRLLAETRAACERARDIHAGRSGRLRVGFMGPAIDGPLSGDLGNFSRAYPDIALELFEKTTPEQLVMLRERALDLGVVRLPGTVEPGVEAILYHRERYTLAVPASHALARLTEIAPVMLDNEPLILFARQLNPSLFDAWAGLFSRAGARLNIVQEATTKHTTLALVAAGLGISPMPESSAQTCRRDVAFVPFARDPDNQPPSLEFHLAVPGSHRPPALENLIRHLTG